MIIIPRNTTRRAVFWAPLITFLLLVTSPGGHAQNTYFVIKSGGKVEATGGKIVLKNTSLTANGVFNASGANVVFTGSANSTISGSKIPVIKTLTLNKGVASTITLETGLKVHALVDFENGMIELNNQTLTLDDGAVLQNETETSRITGTGGGGVTASANAVANPSDLNIGALGASITSAANLGDVTITRMHQAVVNPEHPGKTGIQRTYFVQPANNAALNAKLRFYYFDAELNGNNENTLTLWRSSDGVGWITAGAGTRNSTDNYVEKSGIAKLSYWTLTDVDNVLPITLVYFRATCENKYALIEWKTSSETNTDHFEIERSPDAAQWVSLQNVKALNASTGAAYSYKDIAPQSTAFYRLKTVDKSGSAYYSPVFTGGCADIAMPFIVYPNPAKDVATARISVRENTKAVIQVFNAGGQQVFSSTWALQPGINQLPLPLGQFTAGVYAVKLLLNNNVLQTQLIKQ